MTKANPVIFSLIRGHAHTGLVFLQCLFAVLLIASCGGGAETETQPQGNIPTASGYNGLPPATDDIQAFRIELIA